jgi:hypothetical protein
MFGSEILEVAIGIIFAFLLVSIICTAVREGIEAWVKTRAAFLEYGIREILHDMEGTGLAKDFYSHPLIYSLYSGPYTPGGPTRPALLARGKKLPSYIPAKNFALALMDIAARGPITDEASTYPGAPIITFDSVRTNILNLRNAPVQRVVLTALDSAQGDLNRAQANIQAWYDSSMDRVSGWYKRSSQWIIFWIGLVIAVAMNVNTITIGDYLYRNDAARATIVARAETAVTDTTFVNHTYGQVKKELDAMSLPIGWTEGWGSPRRGNEPGTDGGWNNVVAPILGWLLTALAAMMGAPFWFDLLNKVMVIRSTVKPHEKSPEESSQDHQSTTGQTATAMSGTPGGIPATGARSDSTGSPSVQAATIPPLRSFDASDTEIIR